MLDAEETETAVASAPPTVTVAPAWKLAPVSVTLVPPAAGPEFGATFVSCTAGRHAPPPQAYPVVQSESVAQDERHAFGPQTKGWQTCVAPVTQEPEPEQLPASVSTPAEQDAVPHDAEDPG